MEDMSENINETIDSLIESLINRINNDESFKQEFMELMDKHGLKANDQEKKDTLAIEQYEQLVDQLTVSLKKRAKEPIKFVKLF